MHTFVKVELEGDPQVTLKREAAAKGWQLANCGLAQVLWLPYSDGTPLFTVTVNCSDFDMGGPLVATAVTQTPSPHVWVHTTHIRADYDVAAAYQRAIEAVLTEAGY